MNTEIKKIEDAFSYNGNDISILKGYENLPDEHREFRTNEHIVEEIIAAINKKHNGGKKYVPNWADGSRKWQIVWLWFRPATADDKPEDVVTNRDGVGFVVIGTGYDFTCAFTVVGSRQSFCTEKALIEFRDTPEFLRLYAKIKV